MALKIADRVQVTATANTTVSFTLGAAVTAFQTFAFLSNGDTTYYSATDVSGNWEVGSGLYSTTGPTLTRTVIASSNSTPTPNSPVTFSGTVNVFCTFPAARAVLTDLTETLTSKRINPRITSVSAVATITPNADTDDQVNASGLTGTVTIALPTGTPVDGQKLTLRLSGAATLSWNTVYLGRGINLPTTLASFSYVGCVYNLAAAKWDVIALTGPG